MKLLRTEFMMFAAEDSEIENFKVSVKLNLLNVRLRTQLK
jgi:hypothetical protein